MVTCIERNLTTIADPLKLLVSGFSTSFMRNKHAASEVKA